MIPYDIHLTPDDEDALDEAVERAVAEADAERARQAQQEQQQESGDDDESE